MNVTRLPNKKAIFIIISDLHSWDSNIRNRKSYLHECEYIYQYVCLLLKEVRKNNPGYKIYLVLLGDVAHRGLKSTTAVTIWVQKMQYWRALVNGIFCVTGNHEFTYSELNFYWYCLSTIESDYIKDRGYIGLGMLPIFRIPDLLEVNGRKLFFNHFGNCQIEPCDVLFSHNLYMNDLIHTKVIELSDKSQQKKYNSYADLEELGSFKKSLKYAFFGHNHMFKSKFKVDWDDNGEHETMLYYLASLGRTNIREVQFLDKIRVVPQLYIEEDGSMEIFENMLELPEDKAVLDNVQLTKKEITQDKKDEVKKTKEGVEVTVMQEYELMEGTPLENLKKKFKNDSISLSIIESIQEEGTLPSYVHKYL